MVKDNNILRKKARDIFQAAVESVMPHRLIANTVRLEGHILHVQDQQYSLRPGQKVYVFGSGKGVLGMAESLMAILLNRVAGGVIVTNQSTEEDFFPLQVVHGAHPVPDETSVRGAEMLIDGLSGLKEDDLFFYLLSGGSSALIEKPMTGITLAEMQETTKLLLANGVPIQQINVVRKHLSIVKGGRLCQCAKATGIVLVISDVIGDDLSVIGSGPLYFDQTTFQECEEILRRVSIWEMLSSNVRKVINEGVKGDIPETPKQQIHSIKHYLIGTNRLALEGAGNAAKEMGLSSYILTAEISGEAREVAKVLIAMGRNIQYMHEPFPPPCCLLFGGETTVTVRGNGKGGRNQELVLAALGEMHPHDNILVLSGGTDGIDGNSSAAGAFADGHMLQKASAKGLSIQHYLDNNDSGSFFETVGGLIETGPTGTNVMDITMLIVDNRGGV